MPTGYTSELLENGDMSFEEFAMKCTRGMGVCITMRDDGNGIPIPQRFEPNTYHADSIKRKQKEISELKKLNAKELEDIATKEYEDKLARYIRKSNEIDKNRKVFDNMLNQIEEWTPPTSDHQGLKDFMKDQLLKTIEFDMDKSYYDISSIKKLNGADYFQNELESMESSVLYNIKENIAEIERVENRNIWLKNLRDSLYEKQ